MCGMPETEGKQKAEELEEGTRGGTKTCDLARTRKQMLTETIDKMSHEKF